MTKQGERRYPEVIWGIDRGALIREYNLSGIEAKLGGLSLSTNFSIRNPEDESGTYEMGISAEFHEVGAKPPKQDVAPSRINYTLRVAHKKPGLWDRICGEGTVILYHCENPKVGLLRRARHIVRGNYTMWQEGYKTAEFEYDETDSEGNTLNSNSYRGPESIFLREFMVHMIELAKEQHPSKMKLVTNPGSYARQRIERISEVKQGEGEVR